MKLLPKWFLTGGLPAFRDGESSTALEQTYKVYQAMQSLINEYNEFADEVNKNYDEFVAKYGEDIETFTTSVRQEFQDFIDVVDVKIADLQRQISEMGIDPELLSGKADLVNGKVPLSQLPEMDNIKPNQDLDGGEVELRALEINGTNYSIPEEMTEQEIIDIVSPVIDAKIEEEITSALSENYVIGGEL